MDYIIMYYYVTMTKDTTQYNQSNVHLSGPSEMIKCVENWMHGRPTDGAILSRYFKDKY